MRGNSDEEDEKPITPTLVFCAGAFANCRLWW
jgi:hypothetical protein